MNKDTSINASLPDCQGVYMNIATVFKNMASNMKTELNNARSIGGTITMVEIEDMFATLENQINNSLSQVTNQRIVIELDGNYENVSDKVASNTPQINTESKQPTKKLIKLTEFDLHNIVKESVNRILNEIGDTPMGNFALNAVRGRRAAKRYRTNMGLNDRAENDRVIGMASDTAYKNYCNNKNLGLNNDVGYRYGFDKGIEKYT